MNWFTGLGTACSILSAIIAWIQVRRVKKYRTDIYKRVKVLYFNMALGYDYESYFNRAGLKIGIEEDEIR